MPRAPGERTRHAPARGPCVRPSVGYVTDVTLYGRNAVTVGKDPTDTPTATLCLARHETTPSLKRRPESRKGSERNFSASLTNSISSHRVNLFRPLRPCAKTARSAPFLAVLSAAERGARATQADDGVRRSTNMLRGGAFLVQVRYS